MEIGRKIRELRMERKMTQSSLAKEIGISNSYLCDIEAGRKRVSVDILVKAGGVLGINDINIFVKEKMN